MSIVDWRNPDYLPIWKARIERLNKLRADPALLQAVRFYYREHPADFINDWGVTVDPRVAAKGRPAIMPLLLWPKQREWVNWQYQNWLDSEAGTTVKSRDVGISWLAMGFSIAMCVTHDDFGVGFGSEKEDKVDRSGDPDCLFHKGRMFLLYLPSEFKGGWTLQKHSAHMRLTFPDTGSAITGEAGDNIGRGGRKSIYFVDESAHVPNPKNVDASLSGNTDCRQDMSSVWGTANSFYERAHNPSIRRFDFHWKDDPRKDEEWEKKKRGELDPVIFAAEYDCNFTASVEGVVIPAVWVTAAIDAHKLLGIQPTGYRQGALDVADTGKDANAFAIGQSFLVEDVESWKGTEDLDIAHSVENTFTLCDLRGLRGYFYDADGLGAGVRGDARKINEARTASGGRRIQVSPFRGSGEVYSPTDIVKGTERTAEDFFENAKAQAWWHLRSKFQYTFRLIERLKAGEDAQALRAEINPSQFISIARDFPKRARLCIELSQPIWMQSKRGKVMVDKCPVGTKTEVRNAIVSPNLADAVMMLHAPRDGSIVISSELLAATSAIDTSRGKRYG